MNNILLDYGQVGLIPFADILSTSKELGCDYSRPLALEFDATILVPDDEQIENLLYGIPVVQGPTEKDALKLLIENSSYLFILILSWPRDSDVRNVFMLVNVEDKHCTRMGKNWLVSVTDENWRKEGLYGKVVREMKTYNRKVRLV